jgi:uncharacterized glyoxalase superfamily protein PhnB
VELNAIGIVVQDMGRSLAFYRRLGLEFPGPDTDDHVESTLAGGIRLMLDRAEMVRSFDPHWTPPGGSPRVSFAFQCDNPAAVDVKYAELIAAGATSHRAPWDAMWGQRYSTLRDPDGNGIDLYAWIK